MPDQAAPVLRHLLNGIFGRSEPVGHDGRSLCSIAEMLVLPVVQLHRCLRGITSVAMNVHGQFAVEDGQLGMLVEGQEVFVQLVACGTDNLHRSFAFDTIDNSLHRRNIGRAAHVARTIIVVGDAERALLDGFDERFVVGQVGAVFIALCIVEAVGHHDALSVDALPQTHREGVALVALVEGVGAPYQFLRREADQSAMLGQRRQVVAEAEAVGQEDVRPLGAELLPVERLSEQHIAYPRLWRADDGFIGIPRTARDVPPPFGNVLLHLFILQGIIFLHPRILHTSLEVEDVVGILSQQEEILVQCVPHILADGGLHIPVPLCVEVCVGHHIGLHCLFLGVCCHSH